MVGILYFLHGDHLGSATFDCNGNRVGEARYWPYDEVHLGYPVGAIVTDPLYMEQRWDKALGLYDYRARSYHPTLGRFLQPDPIVPEPGNPQALNRYAYVYHNPLRYTDPTGHCPWCIALAIGVVFVGALLYPDIAYAPDLSADLSRLPPSESHAFERFVAANLPGLDTANDLATLALGRDPLLREEVSYGSREWWLTGVAVLGVGISGGAGRKADRLLRHHIATNKNWIRDPQWSKLFQELFARAGMTLEESANLVELPAEFHKRPHPQAYHNGCMTSSAGRFRN